MFKNRPEVVLLVYAKGGHTAEMQRFINYAPNELTDKRLISLTDVKTKATAYSEQFYCVEARDKFSYIKSIFVFTLHFFWAFIQMARIIMKYKVVGMISTGPGIAILPAILCRLLFIKVIYLESLSRIYVPSFAGRIMYYIANLFFIQHKSLQKHYPKAIYSGRL
jgi:beta-1,4-N-acetylglucosaminyltransferase